MKILFPIGLFYPATKGGPSSTLYWHSCFLNKNAFETFVVASNAELVKNKGIIKNKWIENEAGKVIYCHDHFKYFPFKSLWETLLKIFQVDIVHYSSAYYSVTILTLIFSILLRKKIFLSPRGEFFENAIDNPFKRMTIRFYKLFSTFIIFHATSDEEFKVILKLIPRAKIIIQPNFIDVHTATKTEVHTKNFIFLGLIYGVKKIENLIKAISLSEIFMKSESLLLIAGSPLVPRDFIYLNRLKQLIDKTELKRKVKFIGEIVGKEKERFLKEGYVLVLPSESENFGNVVVESLSQSTPVIASTGTPWKVLKDENAGWWVNNDPVTLSAAIDEALSLSDEEYLKKCSKSLALLNRKFNINTSEDNHWIEIYNNLKSKNEHT
jgi:glycosyltransferase involved in cell wall biosynthesis